MSSSRAFGSRLPDLRTPPPGPASRALADRLRAVESRNVTHLTDDWPIFWEEAIGANVRDADGNVYVDLCAGFGVLQEKPHMRCAGGFLAGAASAWGPTRTEAAHALPRRSGNAASDTPT